MGQRGAKAAFMPSKYVFPGGAVDVADADVAVASPLLPEVAAMLSRGPHTRPAEAFAIAAIRELWEEAGQALALEGNVPPPGWRGEWPKNSAPHLQPMTFVFRAVTPPGRPRRFDARFFMVEADALITDPDDFSNAEDELSHLHWIGLDDARDLPLPFITEIVLAEIEEILREGAAGRPVPFFDHDTERSKVSFLAPL
jgi:8-oxo-dGTP pyrophosphatase MutT (NUDIX family)